VKNRSTRRGRRFAVLAAVAVLVPMLGVPAQAEDPLDPLLGDPGTTLPNLVPDVGTVALVPTFVLDEPSQTFVYGPPELWFDTWIQNLGSAALQLVFDGIEDPQTATAAQCVSWRAPHVCREQVPVGGFSWHDEHKHFHFNEFANYQIRKLRRNGAVDYRPRGLVVESDKVSFCLVDSTSARDDAFPAPYYTSHCTPTVEGISPGWADIYDSGLDGQQLPMAGLTDGRYALVITTDYANRIHETDDTDNVVEVILEVSGGMTQVAVVGRNYPPS
jgi:hypothetical protein